MGKEESQVDDDDETEGGTFVHGERGGGGGGREQYADHDRESKNQAGIEENPPPELRRAGASGESGRADFGLVNVEGYLDLFEIKKPSTQLLARTQDRGNYYWATPTVKALVQAEKYLFNAERKANALEADIERERDIDVRVVRPHAVVIVGHSQQISNNKMRDDFRVLRESLRNVEVVLYDELLSRLKNQKDKIYVDPEIKLTDSIG